MTPVLVYELSVRPATAFYWDDVAVTWNVSHAGRLGHVWIDGTGPDSAGTFYSEVAIGGATARTPLLLNRSRLEGPWLLTNATPPLALATAGHPYGNVHFAAGAAAATYEIGYADPQRVLRPLGRAALVVPLPVVGPVPVERFACDPPFLFAGEPRGFNITWALGSGTAAAVIVSFANTMARRRAGYAARWPSPGRAGRLQLPTPNATGLYTYFLWRHRDRPDTALPTHATLRVAPRPADAQVRGSEGPQGNGTAAVMLCGALRLSVIARLVGVFLSAACSSTHVTVSFLFYV